MKKGADDNMLGTDIKPSAEVKVNTGAKDDSKKRKREES